jgi:hypothetical protein
MSELKTLEVTLKTLAIDTLLTAPDFTDLKRKFFPVGSLQPIVGRWGFPNRLASG